MKRCKSGHEFFTWWLMRHGTGEVPHEYGNATTNELYAAMPHSMGSMQDMIWNGWVTEKTYSVYKLTDKAIRHISKYNKGESK